MNGAPRLGPAGLGGLPLPLPKDADLDLDNIDVDGLLSECRWNRCEIWAARPPAAPASPHKKTHAPHPISCPPAQTTSTSPSPST
jgi:hypothetical protein